MKLYIVWKDGEVKIEHYLTQVDAELFRYLGYNVKLAEDGEHDNLDVIERNTK